MSTQGNGRGKYYKVKAEMPGTENLRKIYKYNKENA